MTDTTLRQTLMAASEAERVDLLTDFLRTEAARRLDVDPSQVELQGQMIELGMSSLKAFELKLHLEEQLGFRLRSSVLFDYPTLETLVPFLLSKLSAAPVGVRGAGLHRPRPLAEPTTRSAPGGAASELARELDELARAER